jgi:hypothetical protein
VFTIAKLIDANPRRKSFLTTNLFVYDEESKVLSVIMIYVDRSEILWARLLGCGPGPATFQEVLRELGKGMEQAPDKTRLIYKEHIEDINDVEDFAIEHFKEYVEGISVMGTHEDVAEILRKCFEIIA